MKSKWLPLCVALGVSMMITSVHPGQAQLQELEPAAPQWMTDMLDQGWHKVAEGVLQRSEGEGSPVESFIYNEEGLLWRVEQLQGRVRLFEGLYNTSPSQDLATVIADLKNEITETQDRLRSGEAEPFTGNEMADCTINYGAAANATWLTSYAGVSGTASAHFSSNCGHYGKVYASVYVHALDGTVENTKTQTDDRPESTSASAFAHFTAKGSSQCTSYAVARVESSALNLSYTTEQWNFDCPIPNPPLTVTISGQPDYYTYYYGPQCTTVTWYATPSGGYPGYTVNWYISGYNYGSGTSFSQTYCNQDAAVTVTAVVTDSHGQTAQASSTSWVYHEDDPYYCGGYNCNCGGPRQLQPQYYYEQPYELCPVY